MRNLQFPLIPILACAVLAGGLSFQGQGTLYSQDRISQMVAPIALYPDALMSQVLMASTFPDQVADADQWVQANPGLTGNPLDEALATATWDPSVIALCKFPSALDRMAQNMAWTTDLGNAFLNQRTDVMDAVQTLRSEAYRNGHLTTTPQHRVVVEGPDIVIQPYAPEVIYVPAYQPAVVYGSYWNYPSYYYPDVWAPWPGYSFVNGFAWGIGFAFGNILFGGCDWGHHDVWMDYGVIHGCSIYHNSPYYDDGHWRGGHGHQPWERHHGGTDYARGGTGAPYGGRDNGRIHGVRPGSARPAAPRTEPASVRGSRPAARGTADISARGAGRPSVNAATASSVRGSRPSTHGPADPSGKRAASTAAHSSRAYSERNASRPTAHGPLNLSGQRTERPAANGSAAFSTHNASRPSAHGPAGYPTQRSNRAAMSGTANYSQRGANRPAMNRPANSPARNYNRPSARPSSNYTARGASRPTASGPSGYARSGNSHSSYARPSAPSGRASAPSGHAGGGRQGSAAPRGGGGSRGHR